MPTEPTVFISYSHKDEVWKDRLLDHLGVLEEEGLLKTWNDRNLGAGDEWLEEIRAAMNDAQVAVFLVSAHSLNSKFIRHHEIPHLLERREKEGMTFFPVIVRSSIWGELSWLSRFQARPLDGKPLAKLKGDQRDEALAKIAKEILSIVRNGAPQVRAVNPPDPSTLTTLAPLHQLPTPPADFTGREEDLEFLRSVLSQGSTGAILGIRGMRGVGKTTLALKLAAELKPRFPDAQIYLDLKGVDPQPLTPSWAMGQAICAFHPEARLPESEAERAKLYRSVLDGKRVLLLLDNAAGDKKQVELLIPPSTCLVLLTSRFRFALPGSIDIHMEAMPEKDARELLLRIAPRIGSAAGEIARICGRLPLALRLAGSALAERPNLAPSEYVRRFKEGKETLEPVEASLKTSYDLLNAERRRLWRFLAVFPETFDSKAAAAVWELEIDDAESQLGELVKNCLVEWEETEERYRLHDLARDLAYKQISVDEQEKVRRRHAEHFLGILRLAESLYLKGGQESRQGLALFDREWSNIRVGQAWTAAQFQDREKEAELCSGYPSAAGAYLDLRLQPREKIVWFNSGIASSRHLKNRESETRHLGNLGNAHAEIGEIQHAIELYKQALTIDREIGDRKGEGTTLGNLGLAYANLGETHRAIEFYEQQLAIAREIGDRRGEGNALGSLGLAYADLGETHSAIEFYKNQLTIVREIGYRMGEGRALGNLGNAYATLGESRRAIEYYEQVLTIAREMGDRQAEAIGNWNLGDEVEKTGGIARAADLRQAYVDYLREIGHPDAEERAAYVAALRARIADAARD